MIEVHFLPADGGDFLWIRWKGENRWGNLLIDSGFSSCVRDYKSVMDYIRNAGEVVDAVVLTHIDDDHIMGFLTWLLQSRELPTIQRIFFNTGRVISQKLGIPFSGNWPEDSVEAVPTSAQYGVGTAVRILDALEDRGLYPALQGCVVSSPDPIHLEQGAEMRFISPSPSALSRFAQMWDRRLSGMHHRGVAAYGTTGTYTCDLLSLMGQPYQQDRSVTNGASLAFLFKFKGERLAFLGDAWSEECVSGLNAAGWSSTRPYEATLVKLSHHGSPRNLSPELVQTLRSSCFLMSTKPCDSRILPSQKKLTIARLLSEGRPITIIQNCPFDKGFLTQDDKARYEEPGILRLINAGWNGESRIALKGGLTICGKTGTPIRPYCAGL